MNPCHKRCECCNSYHNCVTVAEPFMPNFITKQKAKFYQKTIYYANLNHFTYSHCRRCYSVAS